MGRHSLPFAHLWRATEKGAPLPSGSLSLSTRRKGVGLHKAHYRWCQNPHKGLPARVPMSGQEGVF